jgi:hypothetical protein
VGRRPLPNIPRLARRPRRKVGEILLACPRVSPEWELAALKALMKPQTKGAILHRAGEQVMTGEVADEIRRVVREFGERTGFAPEVHWPEGGDYYFAASLGAGDVELARALAVGVSRMKPGLWLVVGKLLVCEGKFFRRRRGVKLELAEATSVRVPREFRAVLEAIRCEENGGKG